MSGLVIRSGGPRQSRAPAFVVAILLHLAVLALVLFVPSGAPKPVGSSVPINIVSSAPFTDTRPAVQAPKREEAQAPQPVPEAKPQPPAPVPAPTPAFTETRPRPVKPQPQPTPTPQPSLKAAPPAAKPFDFNHMQQIIDSARKNAGAPASSAKRGPAKVETDTIVRPDTGHDVSQSDLAGLQQLLQRLWILPCDRPELGNVPTFKVTFTVLLSGRLLQDPKVSGAGSGGVNDIVVRGALDAVRAATPLPQSVAGQTVTVNFNPKKAYASKCSN